MRSARKPTTRSTTESLLLDPLIRDPPAIKPLKMPPLATGPHHAKANRPEQPEKSNDRNIQRAKQHPVDFAVELARRPVHAEARREDRKIQRGIVVMHVRDAAHGNEGRVVQGPANHGIETRVVDLVDVGGRKLRVAALPADEVPEDHEAEDT